MPLKNPPPIPEGMFELLKGLAKHVIKEQPENIYKSAAEYFENLLRERDGSLDKGYEKFHQYESEIRHKKLLANSVSGSFSDNAESENSKLVDAEAKQSQVDMEVNGVAMQVQPRSSKIAKLPMRRNKKQLENAKSDSQDSGAADYLDGEGENEEAKNENKDTNSSEEMNKIDVVSSEENVPLNIIAHDQINKHVLTTYPDDKSLKRPRTLSSKKISQGLLAIKEESGAEANAPPVENKTEVTSPLKKESIDSVDSIDNRILNQLTSGVETSESDHDKQIQSFVVKTVTEPAADDQAETGNERKQSISNDIPISKSQNLNKADRLSTPESDSGLSEKSFNLKFREMEENAVEQKNDQVGGSPLKAIDSKQDIESLIVAKTEQKLESGSRKKREISENVSSVEGEKNESKQADAVELETLSENGKTDEAEAQEAADVHTETTNEFSTEESLIGKLGENKVNEMEENSGNAENVGKVEDFQDIKNSQNAETIEKETAAAGEIANDQKEQKSQEVTQDDTSENDDSDSSNWKDAVDRLSARVTETDAQLIRVFAEPTINTEIETEVKSGKEKAMNAHGPSENILIAIEKEDKTVEISENERKLLTASGKHEHENKLEAKLNENQQNSAEQTENTDDLIANIESMPENQQLSVAIDEVNKDEKSSKTLNELEEKAETQPSKTRILQEESHETAAETEGSEKPEKNISKKVNQKNSAELRNKPDDGSVDQTNISIGEVVKPKQSNIETNNTESIGKSIHQENKLTEQNKVDEGIRTTEESKIDEIIGETEGDVLPLSDGNDTVESLSSMSTVKANEEFNTDALNSLEKVTNDDEVQEGIEIRSEITSSIEPEVTDSGDSDLAQEISDSFTQTQTSENKVIDNDVDVNSIKNLTTVEDGHSADDALIDQRQQSGVSATSAITNRSSAHSTETKNDVDDGASEPSASNKDELYEQAETVILGDESIKDLELDDQDDKVSQKTDDAVKSSLPMDHQSDNKDNDLENDNKNENYFHPDSLDVFNDSLNPSLEPSMTSDSLADNRSVDSLEMKVVSILTVGDDVDSLSVFNRNGENIEDNDKGDSKKSETAISGGSEHIGERQVDEVDAKGNVHSEGQKEQPTELNLSVGPNIEKENKSTTKNDNKVEESNIKSGETISDNNDTKGKFSGLTLVDEAVAKGERNSEISQTVEASTETGSNKQNGAEDTSKQEKTSKTFEANTKNIDTLGDVIDDQTDFKCVNDQMKNELAVLSLDDKSSKPALFSDIEEVDTPVTPKIIQLPSTAEIENKSSDETGFIQRKEDDVTEIADKKHEENAKNMDSSFADIQKESFIEKVEVTTDKNSPAPENKEVSKASSEEIKDDLIKAYSELHPEQVLGNQPNETMDAEKDQISHNLSEVRSETVEKEEAISDVIDRAIDLVVADDNKNDETNKNETDSRDMKTEETIDDKAVLRQGDEKKLKVEDSDLMIAEIKETNSDENLAQNDINSEKIEIISTLNQEKQNTDSQHIENSDSLDIPMAVAVKETSEFIIKEQEQQIEAEDISEEKQIDEVKEAKLGTETEENVEKEKLKEREMISQNVIHKNDPIDKHRMKRDITSQNIPLKIEENEEELSDQKNENNQQPPSLASAQDENNVETKSRESSGKSNDFARINDLEETEIAKNLSDEQRNNLSQKSGILEAQDSINSKKDRDNEKMKTVEFIQNEITEEVIKQNTEPNLSLSKENLNSDDAKTVHSRDLVSSDLSDSDTDKNQKKFNESGVDETSRDERDEVSEVENFDLSSCGEDSLEAMYYMIRKNEIMIDKTKQTVNSEEMQVEEKISFPEKATENLGKVFREMSGKKSLSSMDSSADEVIVKQFSTDTETHYSQRQSASSANGYGRSAASNKQQETEFTDVEFTNPILASMRRNERLLNQMHAKAHTIHTIERGLDDDFERDNFPEHPLEDMRMGNIERNIMASSLSEADSDYNEPPSLANRLTKDDFNVSTAFEHMIEMGSTTDSDSTIESAATKIQAGARGFLTRRRLRRSSAGTASAEKYSSSIGNAAIDNSLEKLVEQLDNMVEHKYTLLQETIERTETVDVEENTVLGITEVKVEQRTTTVSELMDSDRNDAIQRNSSAEDDEGKVVTDDDELDETNRNQQIGKTEEIHREHVIRKQHSSSAKERTASRDGTALRTLGPRQRSMPVQIETQFMRVCPKHLRKRIKSADLKNKF